MRPELTWMARVGVLGTVSLFSLINLGVSAGYIAKIHSLDIVIDDGFNIDTVRASVPAFAGLALAISLLSLLAFVPLLVIDFLRRGAITSWVMVELAALYLFMILWLATAADTAAASDGLTIDCDGSVGVEGSLCHMYQAIEAFSFINWLLLLFYSVTLSVFTGIAYNRGNTNVLKSTVRETDFFEHPSAGVSVPMTQQPQYTGTTQYGTPQYETPLPTHQQGLPAQVQV